MKSERITLSTRLQEDLSICLICKRKVENGKYGLMKSWVMIVVFCFIRHVKTYQMLHIIHILPNIGQVIKGHNKTVLTQEEKKSPETYKRCNCRKKLECPLNKKHFTSCIVYRASIQSEGQEHTYIGLKGGTFKKRHANHKSSFNHENQILSSELSKKIWTLKDENKTFIISWDIVRKAQPRKPGQKTCGLWNSEKLAIIQELRNGNNYLLNRRSEIASKCQHTNQFQLKAC